jgi:hypothetical protein
VARRAQRGWDDDEDDYREPRRRPPRHDNTGLVVGLVIGGVVLFLAVIGTVAALLVSRAGPAPAVAGDQAAAPTPAGPVGAPFVPPDVNPPNPPPNPGQAAGGRDQGFVPPNFNPPAPQPPGPAPGPGLPGRWTGGMRRFADNQILTVIITGVRDDQAGKYVLDKLARQLPQGNSSTQSFTSGGVMRVALAPVGDPQAFAATIDFGTVTRVEGRVIYVTLKDVPRPQAGAFPTPRPAGLPKAPPAAGDLPGLAGYWSLDEGEGDQAGNAAGSRQGAAVHHGKWVPGVRGQALAFARPDSYVDLGTSDDLNFPAHAAFAVAVWVQPAGASGTLLSLRHRTDEAPVLDVTLGGGQATVTLRYDGNVFGTAYRVAGGKLDDGNWHHVVVQRNAADQLELYVDGAAVQSTATAGGSLTTNLRALGRELRWMKWNPDRGDPNYEGCVDEFCAFKRALKPEEIRKLAGRE